MEEDRVKSFFSCAERLEKSRWREIAQLTGTVIE